jgi:hypothetical protein
LAWGVFILQVRNSVLDDLDFGADGRFAGEFFDSAANECHDTVFGGVDCVVAALECTCTWDFVLADLADDDLAFFDLLATVELDTKALAGGIMVVMG